MDDRWEEPAPGVWRRRGSGARLAVIGSIHGDEPAGAQVVHELRQPTHPVWSAAPEADVTLVVGNPDALALGLRSAPGGCDLNRLFGPGEPASGPGPEYGRAAALRELLGGVTHLLDLHQTACDTPPMAIAPESAVHRGEAAVCGLGILLTGVGAAYGGRMVAEWIDRAGGVGLTVETGRKGSEEALESARRVALGFITRAVPAPLPLRVYAFERSLKASGPGLRFVRPLGNTSPVRAGELIGHLGDGQEVRVPADGALFVPREGVGAGEPWALLAADRGEGA